MFVCVHLFFRAELHVYGSARFLPICIMGCVCFSCVVCVGVVVALHLSQCSLPVLLLSVSVCLCVGACSGARVHEYIIRHAHVAQVDTDRPPSRPRALARVRVRRAGFGHVKQSGTCHGSTIANLPASRPHAPTAKYSRQRRRCGLQLMRSCYCDQGAFACEPCVLTW